MNGTPETLVTTRVPSPKLDVPPPPPLLTDEPSDDVLTGRAKGRVTHLRYIGLALPDLREATDFYESVWGLYQIAEDKDVVFFGAIGTTEAYSFRLRKSEHSRSDVIAFAARDNDAVDEIADDLARQDIKALWGPATLPTPGGGYGVRFFDPDGRTVEVSAGVAEKPYRYPEPREAAPNRLSHVVLNSPNVKAVMRFYQTILGFRLSDWLEDRMCFLRCSPDHHSIAIIDGLKAGINHVAFEVRGLDEYMRATGRAIGANCKKLWGPGRHAIGDNTFSYFMGPGNFILEYSTELAAVDEDTWAPHRYTGAAEYQDQWGTAGSNAEALDAWAKVEDAGLWVPAPV